MNNTNTDNKIPQSTFESVLIKLKIWRNIVFAWICMCLAIVSGAAIGPMFKFMESKHITPCLAASWRCQCMVLFLAPFAIIELFCSKGEDGVVGANRIEWLSIKPDLDFPLFVYIIIAGIAWASNLLFWIYGLQYTSIVRASLLASTHPLLLVVVVQLRGVKVSKLEWLGVIVTMIGIVLSTIKGLFVHLTMTQSDEPRTHEFVGDVLCLLAAAAEVVVIINQNHIKKYAPLMQYSAWTTMMVAFITSLASIIFEGRQFLCLRENCIFGWLSRAWFPIILGFGTGVACCILGFNYAVKYISPIVFSSVVLLDTPVTGIISWIAGLEGMPDIGTWLGGLVIISGVGFISVGEHYREDASQADAAAVSATGTVASTDVGDAEQEEEEEEDAHLSQRDGVTDPRQKGSNNMNVSQYFGGYASGKSTESEGAAVNRLEQRVTACAGDSVSVGVEMRAQKGGDQDNDDEKNDSDSLNEKISGENKCEEAAFWTVSQLFSSLSFSGYRCDAKRAPLTRRMVTSTGTNAAYTAVVTRDEDAREDSKE